MKQTVRLLLGDRKLVNPNCVMGVLFGSFGVFLLVASLRESFAAFLAWLLCAGPILGLMAVGFWCIGRQHRRLDALQVVCGPEGIGMAHAGQDLWILPWDRYGGFRRASAGFWRSFVQPETASAFDIYDREGILRGVIPSGAAGTGNALVHATVREAIREELERRVPEGGIRPEPRPVPFERISARKAKQMIVSGIVIALPTTYLFGLVRDAWFDGTEVHGRIAWMADGFGVLIPLSGTVVGSFLTTWGILALGIRRTTEARNKIAPQEEGPTILQLRLEQAAQGKVCLKEGSRYRYLHPEELRFRAKGDLQTVRVTCYFATPILILSAIVIFLDPSSPRAAWLGPTVLLGLTVWLLIDYNRRYGTLLSSLKDTLIYSHGMLVVVRPDGSHLSFPGVSDSYRTDLGSIRIRSLRNGKDRYSFLPTRLYPVGPVEDLDPELALPLVEQA